MPADANPGATGHGLLLVPQGPLVRTIFFKEGGYKRLVFPFTLFGMFYSKTPQMPFMLKRLHVIFGQKPFTGLDPQEEFFGLPVRNHDGAFATCFYAWPGEKTAERFARLIINQYWMSPYAEYNDWTSWWTHRYKALDPKFLQEWEAATRARNYRWIFERQMLKPEHHVNLGKLLAANKSHTAAGGIEVINLETPHVSLEKIIQGLEATPEPTMEQQGIEELKYMEQMSEAAVTEKKKQDEIELRAYLLWEAAGKPEGDGIEFWEQAKQEVW